MNKINAKKCGIEFLFICAFLLLFFACKKKSPQILVAKVDSKNIFADAVVEKFRDFIPAINPVSFNRNKALILLQPLIEEQLIFNEAVVGGFTDDMRIKKSLANIRNLVYYRAALAHLTGNRNLKTKAQQDLFLHAESQQLLQKYGLVLNEEEIEKKFLALKKQTNNAGLDDKNALAEFDGGKIFISDLSATSVNLENIRNFKNHIISIARKKVFAVWLIKNHLHKEPQIIDQLEKKQKEFIIEKYELVQFNQFLKSINKERLNISNGSLRLFLKKLNSRQKKLWENHRTAWIESMKQRHQILLSEKGLQKVIVKIRRLAPR